MNMLTQLCAVVLMVHARDSEENTTFASVAVISQHKDPRSVDASERARLVADKIIQGHQNMLEMWRNHW